MAYPSTTISTQPWRTGLGKPLMTPKKIINMPHPNLGVQKTSKASQMGLSVQPPPPKESGIALQQNIIYVPQKQIDMSLQKYYSAKNRLLRQMRFTRNLLRLSYNSTKFANRLNSGRELFQRALQIRNEVKGLSAPLSLDLARDERQRRAVGSSVQSGLQRNDINALVRQGVPSHQGADVTNDDSMLPSGGMQGAKEEAVAEQEELEAPVTRKLMDQMEHFQSYSTMPEIAEEAGGLRRDLEEALESANSGEELDNKVEQGGVPEVADEYAGEGSASGVDTELTKDRQEQALLDEMTELQVIASETTDENEMRKLRNLFGILSRKYERLTGRLAGGTLTGEAPRRTRRRALLGLTEAPPKTSKPVGTAGGTTATLEAYNQVED